MKILLIGDFSNYHVCLGDALARHGHAVTVASDGSAWMDTRRSLDLRRPLPGPLGGAILYARTLTSRLLRGHDIVSLISPAFITLRPHRLHRIFDLLRRHNGSVFLSATGTDKAFMDMVAAPDCPLRYSEYYMPDGLPNPRTAAVFEADRRWQQGPVADLCEYVYDNVDGVTTALYEYHKAMERRIPSERLAYVGIPVDTHALKPLERPLMADGTVNIFLGRDARRAAFKGTDMMLDVARALVDELPSRCRLTLVENVPYSQYVVSLASADLVLDQLYSFSPATNALMAMARGQAVVSGAEPEYYEFIGETDNFPILNAVPDPDALYALLMDHVLQPELILAAASRGREFVLRHNAANVVARRCLDFWISRLEAR